MKLLRRPLSYEACKISKWKSDKNFEETSINYLDKKTDILKELNCKEFITDKERQVKGIDLICNIPIIHGKKKINIPQYVDVKSIAGLIPTFSFEISGNHSTNQIGWLINEDYKTTYYLLVYHTLKKSIRTGNYTTDKSLMTVDNIEHTKVLLINKKKIVSYILNTLGVHTNEFSKMIKSVRKASEEQDSICRYVYVNGKLRKKREDEKSNIIITCSKQIKEEPINLVINRQSLERIAEKIWEVHHDASEQPYTVH